MNKIMLGKAVEQFLKDEVEKFQAELRELPLDEFDRSYSSNQYLGHNRSKKLKLGNPKLGGYRIVNDNLHRMWFDILVPLTGDRELLSILFISSKLYKYTNRKDISYKVMYDDNNLIISQGFVSGIPADIKDLKQQSLELAAEYTILIDSATHDLQVAFDNAVIMIQKEKESLM